MVRYFGKKAIVTVRKMELGKALKSLAFIEKMIRLSEKSPTTPHSHTMVD